MQKIHRIMLVIILVMIVFILALDYFGFGGTIFLDKVGDGVIVTALNGFTNLFQGKDGNTNILYMTIFGACAMVGLIAIFYKFIKG